MSVPNNPVVRHSRRANRIAIRFRTRKLLLLLTARIDWCLGKEVNLRVGATQYRLKILILIYKYTNNVVLVPFLVPMVSAFYFTL